MICSPLFAKKNKPEELDRPTEVSSAPETEFPQAQFKTEPVIGAQNDVRQQPQVCSESFPNQEVFEMFLF